MTWAYFGDHYDLQALLLLISVMHPNILPLSSYVISISRYVKIFIIFIEKHYCFFLKLQSVAFLG